MKLGIISLGGKSSKSIIEEAKNHFDVAEHLDLKQFEVRVDSKEMSVMYKGKPLENFDCLYVRGSFRYALLQRSITRALCSEVYMPLSPQAFTLGHNKFLTLLELQKNKVPLPKTYFAATTDIAKELLNQVHYPIIMKIPSGTQGKGVMFADSINAAKSILDALETFNQPYLLQEYVETGATDLRVIVVGKKVVAAMKRKALPDELRANIHAGGKGLPYEPDYDTEQIAIKSAAAIGADVCAIDILDAGGKPQVIEVNLSPGLAGITKATRKNIAGTIAKFLYEKTKEFHETKETKRKGDALRELELDQKKEKEILTSLDIKAGIIRLPKIIANICDFCQDEEVSITVKKDQIIIKKHEIKKD
ncbi:MAG: RimK family alpha-L-glutamate ligase [Candidatus Woesearchaeota archaeon]